MLRKKITIRFDLDCPEDRRAWEYLQGLHAVSLNRTVLAIINQAESASLMQESFRGILREELAAALKQLPIQPVQTEPKVDDEMADTLMDFLESFS